MNTRYRAFVGRQRPSGKIIIEEVLPDGKSVFHDWDQLKPDERRWFRMVAHDPFGYLRGATI